MRYVNAVEILVRECPYYMFQHITRAFTCLMVALLLLGIAGAMFGMDYYPATYYWGFQNCCYLGFNQAMNFTTVPNQGVLHDSSLVGYWNMNEGSGTVAHDSSVNGNNGTITGASWVDGKYGEALSFNGSTDYALTSYSSIFNFGTGPFSWSCWVTFEAQSNGEKVIMRGDHEGVLPRSLFSLGWVSSGTLKFACYDSTIPSPNQSRFVSKAVTLDGNMHFIMGVRDGDNIYLYIDAVVAGSTNGVLNHNINSTNRVALGKYEGTIGAYLKGIIDEVRVYNRALSVDVSALYAMGQQPDPVSFANYYSFNDPVTNNTMLIHVDDPDANRDNVALVTCTNFFEGNRLAFQANNSATVNVWTNLGRPAFTTGAFVWNGENYTTTLTLDASSTGELNWNTYNITTYADAHSGVFPSNVTVGYGGSQIFNFNASQGYGYEVLVDGVSQGHIGSYTFSNVTASHMVNVTSALLKYTITASTDTGSTISPSGDVSVNYGGSQLFTVQNKTGYNVKHVYVDSVDKGAVSNYTFSNVTGNHVISVSSESLSSTNSSTPTPTPTPTPTSQPETNQFPTQTAVIAVIAVATLIAGFALAFKKGYITIEIADEDKSQEENQEDYNI